MLLPLVRTARAAPPLLRAPAPRLLLDSLNNNLGATSVFDNVNIGVSVIRGLRMLGSDGHGREQLSKGIASLANGLDEAVFIAVYLLTIRRLLKALWRAASWASRREAQPPPTDASFERSFLGALVAPACTFGWAMMLLWGADAAYILGLSLNPAMAKRRQLLKAVAIMAYTYTSGRLAAAVKNWWLEHTTKLWRPPPSATARAVWRRGSGTPRPGGARPTWLPARRRAAPMCTLFLTPSGRGACRHPAVERAGGRVRRGRLRRHGRAAQLDPLLRRAGRHCAGPGHQGHADQPRGRVHPLPHQPLQYPARGPRRQDQQEVRLPCPPLLICRVRRAQPRMRRSR